MIVTNLATIYNGSLLRMINLSEGREYRGFVVIFVVVVMYVVCVIHLKILYWWLSYMCSLTRDSFYCLTVVKNVCLS